MCGTLAVPVHGFAGERLGTGEQAAGRLQQLHLCRGLDHLLQPHLRGLGLCVESVVHLVILQSQLWDWRPFPLPITNIAIT